MHHSHQLSRVSTEHEAAFAEFYQRHASAIFSYLCQHTKTYEDAEDLLLEVFSSVLEEEAFFERSTAQQSGWLWRVARNKRIDAYRREQRRPALVLDLVTDSLYEDEKHEPEHMLKNCAVRRWPGSWAKARVQSACSCCAPSNFCVPSTKSTVRGRRLTSHVRAERKIHA